MAPLAFLPFPGAVLSMHLHPASDAVSLRERIVLTLGAAIWIVLTGVLDNLTGTEYRIFPLYFLPICLVGWRLGYVSTLAAAWLSALTWLLANRLGGLQYSSSAVWVVNTITQGASFSVVGALVVVARKSYLIANERSRTDALTGLLNSRAFSDEAARIIALCDRHHRAVTVAYVDLDHFKQVNDRLGHDAGDQVLARVATAMLEAGRETDVVARLGGDEFALLLPETDAKGAAVVLERVRAKVALILADAPVPVTTSIGAVVSSAGPRTIADLLKLADKQLYVSKGDGKNRVTAVVLDA